jgi:hypothetical protein
MSEAARCGREQIETGYTLKQITDAGVRVFFYLEDRERTLGTAMDKVMMSLSTFAAEMEREKARQRTRDALARKARAGAVTGTVPFGYRPTRTGDGRSHRVIADDEAAVVRRIFTMAAAGIGYYKIATALNAEGAPAPRRSGSWSRGGVREVLARQEYLGRVIWGRKQNAVRRGRSATRPRPEGEWICTEMPELAVVEAALWQAARARLGASRAVYGERPSRPPVNGIDSRYLLTGFMECGACGGGMFAHNARNYVCRAYHTRGRVACKNGRFIHMGDADAAVLGAVERDVLRVEVLETALSKAWDALQAPADAGDRTATLRAELAQLDGEVARLAGAIATGGALPALLAALQDRERRRGQVRRAIAEAERRPATPRDAAGLARALDTMRGALADWQRTLRQEPPAARQALRALLAGRLAFTPEERDGGRIYTFEGPGTVAPIIAGVLPMPGGTPGRGAPRTPGSGSHGPAPAAPAGAPAGRSASTAASTWTTTW